MTFINSGVPNSRRGISLVLYYQMKKEKCHFSNNIIIDYISKEAPSMFKPRLRFVLCKVVVRKGSFGWQLTLTNAREKKVEEESRLLSSLCRENLRHRKVASVEELYMSFDQPL